MSEVIPNDVIPSTEQLRWHFLSTVRHGSRVEFYLQQHGIDGKNPDRPHDMRLPGNKLEWEVAIGISFGDTLVNEIEHASAIRASVKYHQTYQPHHLKWNFGIGSVTDNDMLIGAFDTICTWMDDRPYQGGCYSFQLMMERINGNRAPHSIWLLRAFGMIIEFHYGKGALSTPLEQLPSIEPLRQFPPIMAIQNLDEFPNVGISDDSYAYMRELVSNAMIHMRSEHGYIGLIR